MGYQLSLGEWAQLSALLAPDNGTGKSALHGRIGNVEAKNLIDDKLAAQMLSMWLFGLVGDEGLVEPRGIEPLTS
jgi:hypothetical protein